MLRATELVTLGFNVAVAFSMMLIVVYSVVLRYFLNLPARWVAEVSEFMLVALTFLVLSHIQRQKRHINITFVLQRLGRRARTVLGIVTTLCALGIFVLLTWASGAFALKALSSSLVSDAAALPLFPARLLVPIGSGLMCLQLLADLARQAGVLAAGVRRSEAPPHT